MLVAMRHLLDAAAEDGYGIPAFNVSNLEQLRAVLDAATEVDAPAIVQVSSSARQYAGDEFIRHMVQAAAAAYPRVPFAVHQDHGRSPAVCREAIALGFTSVMMDGSLEADGKTPASYEYDVAVTREVVAFAHPLGVTVEGELGVLGSLETKRATEEDGHGAARVLVDEEILTDPAQAADFVQQTHVDALAVAIGTSHGAAKFSRPPTSETLDIARIGAIHAAVPTTHLVLHGASSVPQELLDELRSTGATVRATWGVPIEDIRRAIEHGVRKVNIDTDLRLAITAAVRRFFVEHPDAFDPRAMFGVARDAAQRLCARRYVELGAAGHASRVQPRPLGELADAHA